MVDEKQSETEAEQVRGRNSIDPAVLNGIVKRIEGVKNQMESEKGAYMAQCKKRREEIKAIKSEAKDADIPIKQLNALLKDRDLDRDKAKLRSDFDFDEVETLEYMISSLGELGNLPLGAAAIQKKREAEQATQEALDEIG